MEPFRNSTGFACGTLALLVTAATACAQTTVFTDNFNSGASSLWNNLRGNWISTGGVYYAQAPNNNPLTHSAVPFELIDCTIDVDINNVADGGIWMHTDDAGQNGILLVTGGNGWGLGLRNADSGRSLYWHEVINNGYSPPLNQAFDVFPNPGAENTHIRVQVTGNVYSAYVNGSTNATTTLVNSTYPSGRAGLYDFSSQTFDNVVIQVPTRSPGPFRLGITNAAARQFTLYWSTNANGYYLESASSLPQATWPAVTNRPVIMGTNFTVTLGATNTQQFFRLSSQ
jgi:hypothetical protein